MNTYISIISCNLPINRRKHVQSYMKFKNTLKLRNLFINNNMKLMKIKLAITFLNLETDIYIYTINNS